MTMINKELIDPKDLIIGKLKLELEKRDKTIEQFKNYDKKRKEYYSGLATKVGELESYIAELEAKPSTETIDELRKKNKKLGREIGILSAKIGLNKHSVEDVAAVTTLNKMKMKEELNELRNKVKSNKDTINKLLYTINKYREKYGEL